MRKKISVIVSTCRMGGFDVLVNGLREQTFPASDFEVIIVDSCYAERRPHMGIFPMPVNFFHLELPDKFDYYDACYANNYGLRLATGELIVFLTDNIWPEPKFLERHWQIYTNFPGFTMCGFVDRYEIPPLKPWREWRNCYWSVFEQEFTAQFARDYFDGNPIWYSERKGGVHGPAVLGSVFFELPGDFFYGALNESIPMSVLKEINGWNQDMDGGYGVADIELGMRANIAGHKFLTYPESINRKLGSRASANIPGKFKKSIRTPAQQFDLYRVIIEEIKTGQKNVKIENGAW